MPIAAYLIGAAGRAVLTGCGGGGGTTGAVGIVAAAPSPSPSLTATATPAVTTLGLFVNPADDPAASGRTAAYVGWSAIAAATG